MKIIKIAFITYSLSGGGAEKNILLLKKHLSPYGVEADIIMFKDINHYLREFPGTKGIYALTSARSKISFFLLPFYAVQASIKMFLLLKRRNYSVLLGLPHYLPYYVAVIFSWLHRIKSVLVIVNNLGEELDLLPSIAKPLHRFLLQRAFEACSAVVCKSSGVAATAKRDYSISSDKIRIITNGLDLTAITKKAKLPCRGQLASLFRTYCVITTGGRLVGQKNHLGLLALFRTIKDLPKSQDMKLCIFGTGPLLNRLRQKTAELGLENEVFFPGFEANNFYRYLNLSRLFILPSRYEGFGNVLIEALACGVPVISADCPYGPREIITGIASPPVSQIEQLKLYRFGGMMPVPSEKLPQLKTLARGIHRFLQDKHRLTAYRKRARQRSAYYAVDRVCKEYAVLIESLVTPDTFSASG